jgi:hypothetical protein
MAHLWVREDSGEWAALPLAAAAVDLRCSPPRALPAAGPVTDDQVLLLCAPAGGAAGVEWVLLAGAGATVWINGLPLGAGLRALADRDQVHVEGAAPLYFSTERLAAVAAMPGSPQPLFCPRCRQAIETASDAVLCPQCGVWHHQSAALPCWLYAPTCALCPQPTELDGGFRWTPEEL